VDRSTWVLTRDDLDRAMHADEKLKEVFATLFRAFTMIVMFADGEGFCLYQDEVVLSPMPLGCY
jgi:hypothetical protein